jgi:hypothetical protein
MFFKALPVSPSLQVTDSQTALSMARLLHSLAALAAAAQSSPLASTAPLPNPEAPAAPDLPPTSTLAAAAQPPLGGSPTMTPTPPDSLGQAAPAAVPVPSLQARPRPMRAVDGTACAGGNTAALAHFFAVTAVELDADRAADCLWNMQLLGLAPPPTPPVPPVFAVAADETVPAAVEVGLAPLPPGGQQLGCRWQEAPADPPQASVQVCPCCATTLS